MRLIDADALMNQWCDEMCRPKPNCEEGCAIYDYVRLAPTIEPKRGEWISLHNGKWKCSECGIEVLIYAKGNFCPNCGARMKGADDE